ncbi:MAG: carboxypeptidase regulatory-like domain-containing protein [Planctomycetes bacterium]|nr:carboxypeptidase regulatory-like domain-containing protein [Planctomycetota bacterium]
MKSYRLQSKEVSVSGVTVVDFQLEIEEQEPPLGSLEGTVTDVNNGAPIEGAIVQLVYNDQFRETTTDADGKYWFDDVPEDWNPKKILVTKDLFRPESKDIDVEGDTTVDFQLMIEELPPPLNGGALTGVVTDSETDQPMEGATVTLDYHENKLTVQTDDEGRYVFQGIPICFCLKGLSVSMDDYITQAMSIAISEGTVQDVALEPTAPAGGLNPPGIDGSDGRTSTDHSGVISWAIVGLLVSIAGGLLFVITTRLQNRS